MKNMAPYILLACLCLWSCSAGSLLPDEGDGPETASYKVTGTVADEDGKPLKGIQVVSVFEYEESSFTDSMFSDKNGKFEKSYTCSPCKSVEFTFNDTDGESNGGSFASLTVKADIVRIEDAKGSFAGSYLVSYDARLSRK